jgi:hypothetical protein
MVKRKSGRDKFFLRSNTSYDPMAARHIKDAAVRAETAIDRALILIETRQDPRRRRNRPRKRLGIPTTEPPQASVATLLRLTRTAAQQT